MTCEFIHDTYHLWELSASAYASLKMTIYVEILKPVCWLLPKFVRRRVTGEEVLQFWVFCPVLICFSVGIVSCRINWVKIWMKNNDVGGGDTLGMVLKIPIILLNLQRLQQIWWPNRIAIFFVGINCQFWFLDLQLEDIAFRCFILYNTIAYEW